MTPIVWSGIYHCDFTFTDDVGTGAMKCERPGVSCRQSTNTLRDWLYDAVLKIMRVQERNIGHGSSGKFSQP
jgi:hypothetical protein